MGFVPFGYPYGMPRGASRPVQHLLIFRDFPIPPNWRRQTSPNRWMRPGRVGLYACLYAILSTHLRRNNKMNNPGKLISKLTACVQILAITFLAACNLSTQQLNVCHATGDPAKPYEEIIATQAQLKDYAAHPNDYLYPVPANGCPTSALVVSTGMITICHATGSNTSPYDEIKVSVNGLNGHSNHPGDIIPAPAAGCPTTKP